MRRYRHPPLAGKMTRVHISDMPAQLNHTIVHALDPMTSAQFVSEVLGLPPPHRFGPFLVVDCANGVSLDFLGANANEFIVEHYAFLVSEAEFDEIFARLKARNVEHYADPFLKQQGQINRHDGGRGCYFKGPEGHILEIITRPYGSGG